MSCTFRPPSPLIDPVREKYTNQDKLVEDFKAGFSGPDLADVIFIVGKFTATAAPVVLSCM